MSLWLREGFEVGEHRAPAHRTGLGKSEASDGYTLVPAGVGDFPWTQSPSQQGFGAGAPENKRRI